MDKSVSKQALDRIKELEDALFPFASMQEYFMLGGRQRKMKLKPNDKYLMKAYEIMLDRESAVKLWMALLKEQDDKD